MSLPVSYFDDLYAEHEDPWGFTDRWYEQRKRALTLAALPAPRYRRALEPGCSIGVLSSELAQRCDAVVSSDVSDAALERAATRVPANVELRRWGLGEPWPADWSPGSFDLVVLSELGYYLDQPGLSAVVPSLVAALEEGGTLLAAHWRHPVADYPQRGDAVHAQLRGAAGLAPLGVWRDDDVVIEVWQRGGAPARSVAERAGLV